MQAVRLGAVELHEDFQQDDEEEQAVQQEQAELERPGHGGQRLEGMQGQDAHSRQDRRPEARTKTAVQIDPGQQLQGQVAGLGRAAVDFSGKNDIQQEHAGKGKQQALETAKMPPAASVQPREHGDLPVRQLQRRNRRIVACLNGRQRSGGAGHVPVFCHAGAGRGHVTGHRSKADPKAEARDCKARPFDISEPPLPCCGAYAPGMRRTSAPCPQDCRCRIGDGRGSVRHGAPACDHDGG